MGIFLAVKGAQLPEVTGVPFTNWGLTLWIPKATPKKGGTRIFPATPFLGGTLVPFLGPRVFKATFPKGGPKKGRQGFKRGVKCGVLKFFSIRGKGGLKKGGQFAGSREPQKG